MTSPAQRLRDAVTGTRHEETTSMPATPDTTRPDTAAQRIADLEAERDALTAQAEADPVRAAPDTTAWQGRDTRRRQRLLEIENSVRSYQEYGLLIESHGEVIRQYLGVARSAESRNSRVIERRSYEIRNGYQEQGQEARRDIENWWYALGKFARGLPQDKGTGHTEQARIVLSRELEKWFRFRDSWLVASAIETQRGWVPSPEIGLSGEDLPSWVRWGIARIDDSTAAGDAR